MFTNVRSVLKISYANCLVILEQFTHKLCAAAKN